MAPKKTVTLILILNIFFLLGVVFYAEFLIEKKYSDFVQDFDKGLLIRIKNHEEKLSQAISLYSNHVGEIETYKESLRNVANQVSRGMPNIRAEVGTVSLTKNEFPKVVNPDGCEGNRGFINHIVNFDNPFLMPPEVFIALSTFDMREGADHRIKVQVKEIERAYFVIDFKTWCNTKTSMVAANWLAIGK